MRLVCPIRVDSTVFSVDAVRFGIQTLAPKFFGRKPDFVVSGPNVGSKYRVIDLVKILVLPAC